MDSFGNCVYKDNPAARDNIAKPIWTTLSSVRFLTEEEFQSGVIEEDNNRRSKPRGPEEHDKNTDGQGILSYEEPEFPSADPYDTSAVNPEGGDTFNCDTMKERNKWIPQCLDTIEIMKSVKTCTTREIHKYSQDLETVIVNSERNFTATLIRSKRSICELISTPKKSDPDREMKQIQINKYLKTVAISVKTANRIAQDQIHYLRFLDKFTTYLVKKGDEKLFLDCETSIIEMNQTLAALASEAMTRNIVDMECIMTELGTYFVDNILQTVANYTRTLKEENERFLYDINDSSSDLMGRVRNEFQKQASLRQKNKEKIQQTITRLQNKYADLGRININNFASHAIKEFPKQADDLLTVKVSLNPDTQASDIVEKQNLTDVKIAASKDCVTYPRSKDPTKKTSLQPLLRKWTRHLTSLIRGLTSAHDVVLHNFHLYSAETGSSYQSHLRDYRRQFIEDFKHEYNDILEHLLRHVKKMSTKNKHGFSSPLDIMDLEHPDYPHLKERVIDTYVLHTKSVHSKAVDFIIHFTDKFGATLDKCLKLQYKLLKHNNNSEENMNLFRYQNVLLLVTLLRSFYNYLHKQIEKVTSIFLQVSNRMQLQLTSEFRMHIQHFELQSAILTNAFTLALQGIVEKYFHFVERCWKLSKDMGQRDTCNLKGTLKQVYEVVQDFAITQPILLSKKEGEKILKKEFNGAIDGFLTRRFSGIHVTSTPFSILKVPGLLRSILKRDSDSDSDTSESLTDDEDQEGEEFNESKETKVVWTGNANKSKFKVRFEELEDEDVNKAEGEQRATRIIPKDAPPIKAHKRSCGEEIDNDDLNF